MTIHQDARKLWSGDPQEVRATMAGHVRVQPAEESPMSEAKSSKEQALEAFWTKVARGPADACWPWIGTTKRQDAATPLRRLRSRGTAANE